MLTMIYKKHSTHVLRITWVASFFLFLTSSAFSQVKLEELRTTVRDKIFYNYYDISCTDENNCTTVGYSNNQHFPDGYKVFIERTKDGGKTWVIQDCGIPVQSSQNEAKLTKVFAIDSLNIVVAGDSGLLFRTTDAGETWRKQSTGNHVFTFDISFSDSSTGILITDDLLYKTTDAGATWVCDSFSLHKRPISCRSFSANEQSFFKLMHGPVYHTANNGVDWDPSLQIADTSTVKYTFIDAVAAVFLSPSHIFFPGVHVLANSPINGGNTYLAETIDGGQHIEVLFDTQTSIRAGLACMAFNKQHQAIACGNGRGVMFSVNDGKSWHVDTIDQNLPYLDYISAVSFAGNNDVLIVGRGIGFNGSILKLHFPDLLKVEQFEDVKWGTHIYPNPASDWLNIYTNPYFETTYSIFDMLGRKVKDFAPTGKNTRISIEDLPSGSYLLISNFEGKRIPIGGLVVTHSN
jgi:photosystem II stability/assembly factor-like uncharacterized protein